MIFWLPEDKILEKYFFQIFHCLIAIINYYRKSSPIAVCRYINFKPIIFQYGGLTDQIMINENIY